jgi:3'(2'), 5'-bisphosphate nucleotidase
MMRQADVGNWAKDLAGIARAAGAEIMQVYSSGDFGTTSKTDNSPLTEADLRAHKLIVANLQTLTPGIPVLSEESADISFGERSGWSRYWLVDPLDGTKEFLSRNGEFTVNIALIDRHVPVLGVVYAPARDVLYEGFPTGAFRTQNARPALPISVAKSAASPLRVVGSRSHRGDSLDAALERIGAYTMVPIGSSLKLCMVADGSADFYPRLGPTSEWDTAAAHAVVLAAGGEVVNTAGEPLRYNTKAELLNPHFLVYGDRSRNWVELVRG